MKKRRLKPAQSNSFGEPLWWLPIDSRLLPSVFSFRHVRGVPRLFLFAEIFLSSGIVIGTLVIAVLKLASSFLQ